MLGKGIKCLLGILVLPLIVLIRVYQYAVSPMLGSHCRFFPSCSIYAVESLQRYGPFKGGWLVLRRIGRCHPWCSGGHDPVP